MKISEFVGLDAKLQQLMRSAQAGRIVHALLFTGPHGTGKKTMADLFARTVLCTGDGDRPCGVCPACRKCESDAHLDVHRVAPEKNIIKVDQIRDLIDALSLTSREGGKKIAIIDRADSMNESAQNALLKTLENPTGDVLFFLLTEAPGALLPTIVSRCLRVRFSCLDIADCDRVLISRGIAPERAHLAAALAQGSVGRALEIDADPDYYPLRDRVIDAVESLRRDADAQRAAGMIGDSKDRQADILEILELWARDLLRVQNGMEPLESDRVAALKKSGLRGSGMLMHVMQLRRQAASYVAWMSALEAMCFALARDRR